MSGVAGGSGAVKKSSSRAVATKTLIIQEYKRRLRDNIRSLNDNFVNIISATKINNDDNAHRNTAGKMTELYTTKNEMAARAALIVRACDELRKLTNDLKEFLILHDFNVLTQAITHAEHDCDTRMSRQIVKHNALRADVVSLVQDIDKETFEHFSLNE